jgi:uncharacterized membrane protein
MPWPRGVPKNMTPAQRVDRARKAALARTTTEHHIAALAGRTLTDEQRQRLADLLRSDAQPEGVAE